MSNVGTPKPPTVSVLHNVDPDGFFGLNQVEAAPGLERDWVTKPRAHELVRVFEAPVDRELLERRGALAVAEALYRAFNVGDDPDFGTPGSPEWELATAYRARRLRSLSVGDVLVFGDGVCLAVARMGFAEVDYMHLRVLSPADADPAIRSRYHFGPGEELSITVPLPE